MGLPPLIINAALTGNVPTKTDDPHLPVAPAEIVADAARCVKAGASIIHVHARGPDGAPTWRPEVFAETIAGIRRRCPDAVVCATTSGRVHNRLDQRAAVLDLEGPARPDMASLTLGSMNFPTGPSVNAPDTIQALAARMRERGIRPELEVFDLGMVDYARYLLRKGALEPPLCVNLLLGSLGTLRATPGNLTRLVEALPEGTTWAATGIGRSQFFVNAMAVAMGGHVRVGLEDNLWMDDERSEIASNLMLVERVVDVARAMGRPVASPVDVRRILELRHAVVGAPQA